jgi:hypothetical protein
VARFFLKGSGAEAGMRAGAAGAAEAAQLHAHQPARGALAGAGAARRHLLPQRDDLFRQADAVRGSCKRFAPLLREDGLLFAGHSESFLHAADLFRPLGRTVYERADRPMRRHQALTMDPHSSNTAGNRYFDPPSARKR